MDEPLLPQFKLDLSKLTIYGGGDQGAFQGVAHHPDICHSNPKYVFHFLL